MAGEWPRPGWAGPQNALAHVAPPLPQALCALRRGQLEEVSALHQAEGLCAELSVRDPRLTVGGPWGSLAVLSLIHHLPILGTSKAACWWLWRMGLWPSSTVAKVGPRGPT